MKRISSHMRDMVNYYGATCAFIAWLGPERSVYVARTANIQYRNDPKLWDTVHETFHQLLKIAKGMNPIILPRIPVNLCLFQGNISNNRVAQQGWCNKRKCIQTAFEKVQSLTNLPVYISIAGCKGILLKHATDLTALSVLDEYFHVDTMGKRFPPLVVSSMIPAKIIKRRAPKGGRDTTTISEKKTKTWDGEPILQPLGSLERNHVLPEDVDRWHAIPPFGQGATLAPHPDPQHPLHLEHDDF